MKAEKVDYVKTETYRIDGEDNMMFDIVVFRDEYELYIYDPNYSVKEYIFGLEADCPIEKFLEIVLAELENNDHIKWYREKYCN